MSRRPVHGGDLRVGAPLEVDVYDQRGMLLLRRGHIIRSEEQMERLLEVGMFVDGDGGHDDSRTGGSDAGRPEIPRTPLTRLVDARMRLAGVLAAAGDRDIRDDIIQLADEIAEATEANPDLALGSVILDGHGDFTARHAVDSAIVCDVVGRALAWDNRRLASLRAAALTMNVSIAALQNRLQSQSRPLDDAQREAVHAHPLRSRQMLEAMGVDDTLWLATVEDHHENAAGTGYPAGKAGEAVSPDAQLLSMADMFCAHVRARSYRPAMRPDLVMRKLYQEHGGASTFEAELAQHFVKTVGLYPPGTLVRLANGDLAIVTRRGPVASQPEVSTVVGVSGFPLMIPIRRRRGDSKFEVTGAVDPERLPAIPTLRALWGADAELM